MILILGGTTEGRSATRIIDEAGKSFYYSTKGNEQDIISCNGIRLTGPLDGRSMKTFCEEKGIRLIIDAGHPFAEQLHHTVADVSEQTGIPVIRYDRIYMEAYTANDIIWCSDYNDAMNKFEQDDIHHLLALTGVQSIAKLKPFWSQCNCHFRILDRDSSRLIALQHDFPSDRLIYYHPNEDERLVLQIIHPQAILLKESGLSGGFKEKVEAARQENVRIYVIKRPEMPKSFYIINGKHGLRQMVERLLPDFYPLHTGLTTGTCAAAATVAAAYSMFSIPRPTTGVPVVLPNGETIFVPIAESSKGAILERQNSQHLMEAYATVIKYSGDDPDVTNGITIKVTLSLAFNPSDQSQYIENEKLKNDPVRLCGGEGVGIVTLPGLGLELGAPAINATPRKMIKDNLRYFFLRLKASMSHVPFVVTISVPDGEEIAKRTFNPRLGIVGGISIIGTSGIVRPFSSEAFVDAIRKEMEVAKASGTPCVVINSGAKSERAVRSMLPELPAQAFVHYGNFIGETLQIAADLDIKKVTLGVMIGKAVKLAEGHLDTHSKKVVMNKEFLKEIARRAGCTSASMKVIDRLTLARELWTRLPHEELTPFCNLLIEECRKHCAPLLPHGELTILLITEENKIY